MTVEPPHQRLIEALAVTLVPVKPLGRPGFRALSWLAIVGLPGVALTVVTCRHDTVLQALREPEAALAVLGCMATAATAAVAAIQSTLPDRDTRWAWLPVPSLTLWIGAELTGATEEVGDGPVPSLAEACACFGFILCFGVPFALLLLSLLRRGYALRPVVSAGLAGLAAASAATTILGLLHPFSMALHDLGMHALAVALLSGACASLSHRFFPPQREAFWGRTSRAMQPDRKNFFGEV